MDSQRRRMSKTQNGERANQKYLIGRIEASVEGLTRQVASIANSIDHNQKAFHDALDSHTLREDSRFGEIMKEIETTKDMYVKLSLWRARILGIWMAIASVGSAIAVITSLYALWKT